MTQKEVTIAELRLNLADIMGSIMFRGDTVVVTKNRKKAAIIVSPDEYERLLDPSKRLSSPERKQMVAQLETIRANIPEIDPKVIERQVNKAVREVRAERRKKSNRPQRTTTTVMATP